MLIEAMRILVEKYDYKNIWYLCNSTDLRDRDFKKELVAWEADHLEDRITFMCYQTAYKLKNQQVDIVIADEFDYSLTPEYYNVYKNNSFKHQIFTTAYIAGDKMQYVKDISVPIVYRKTLQEVEDKDVLNKSKYYFVNFLMSDQEVKTYWYHSNKIKELQGELRQLQFELKIDYKRVKWVQHKLKTAARNRKMFLNSLESSAHNCRRLMRDIYNTDKSCKIITFCELTSQADLVCKYTYHTASEDNNLEKFRNDEIQALAVCGKINRGVNISGVNNVIFESCNQSKTQLIQRLGRGKRLKNDEILTVYFLIPCYIEGGKLKSTKVRDWIINASEGIDLSNAETYKFKS